MVGCLWCHAGPGVSCRRDCGVRMSGCTLQALLSTHRLSLGHLLPASPSCESVCGLRAGTLGPAVGLTRNVLSSLLQSLWDEKWIKVMYQGCISEERGRTVV